MKPPILTPQLEPATGCIASAMAVLGNKWTALILRDLAAGPKGFCELQKAVGADGTAINPRTLSQRLDDLQAQAIITQQTEANRVLYTLTDKGRDLIPVLRQMAAWGEKYQIC